MRARFASSIAADMSACWFLGLISSCCEPLAIGGSSDDDDPCEPDEIGAIMRRRDARDCDATCEVRTKLERSRASIETVDEPPKRVTSRH